MNDITETPVKQCNKCSRFLPIDTNHFHRHKECKGGFRNTCKECRGSKFGIHQINKVNKAKEGHKFCGKCQKELPLDNVHFYKEKKSKSGWGSWCKKCWGAEDYGITKINELNEAKPGFKFCSVCKNELPKNKFSICNDNKDGLKSGCKKCLMNKHKEYYNRPEVKENKAKYWKKYRKEYYATENGKTVNKRNVQKRRSRKKEAIFNYSLGEWSKTLEVFRNQCAYCGTNQRYLQQEHVIPLSKGGHYTKQNIIPACYRCNGSKHNHDLQEWYPRQPFYSDKRMNKILKWSGIDKKSNSQQLSIF